MDELKLKQILKEIQSGELQPDDAMQMLRQLPYQDLDFAKLDSHRQLRQGFGEVIYAPGKTAQECAVLVQKSLENTSRPVLLSLPNEEQREVALSQNPEAISTERLIYWQPISLSPVQDSNQNTNQVTIISAGTADAPTADECANTLIAHGISPLCIQDVGVAGLHRLLDQVDNLLQAEIVVVVAGMEGALASVVGGITPAPVIAVPTSVGYGTSFDGITALLAMHATCAIGVSVVGIDNGIGAGFVALRQLYNRQEK